MLVKALPWDAPLWVELREAHEKAEANERAEYIRSRQEHYRRQVLKAAQLQE